MLNIDIHFSNIGWDEYGRAKSKIIEKSYNYNIYIYVYILFESSEVIKEIWKFQVPKWNKLENSKTIIECIYFRLENLNLGHLFFLLH